MDQYLDVKRANLCVKAILEELGGRQLVVSDSWRNWQTSLNFRKEVKFQWTKNMADCNRVSSKQKKKHLKSKINKQSEKNYFIYFSYFGVA